METGMKPEKVKRFPRDPKIFDKHVLSCHFQFVNLSFYPENVPHFVGVQKYWLKQNMKYPNFPVICANKYVFGTIDTK